MIQRTAFVTGGANGLGYATVVALMDAGWDVFFTYRTSRDGAEGLRQWAAERGRKIGFAQADLLIRRDVEAALDACMTQFHAIDALVHNFGPFVFQRVSLAEYTDEMWQRMLDGNLSNFFWMYRRVIAGMRTRAFGRIITIGYDGAGEAAGWRYRSAYAAAKTGLASLTRTIAREERQNGITANMVCPGDIRGAHKRERQVDVAIPWDPLGRPPVGEDVGRVIAYLCQPESQWVNGTVTEITGGYDIRAYDDGSDVVDEPYTFPVGADVVVLPWGRRARVETIDRVPNRNWMYHVVSGEMKGSFTAYQLRNPDSEA